MSVDIGLVKALPIFATAEDALISDIASNAVLQTIPKGEQVAYEGMCSDWFFIVLSGDIRVYKMGESGKEITLFNVTRHESCILTIFSILGDHQYPAFASTQSELQALMIPAALFKHWVDKSDSLREHVFKSLSGRLTDILTTFDQVMFQRMDKRIAQFILNKCPNEGDILHMTHEQISHELGTNRVVVSRILEAFETEGALALGRGHITVVDKAKLVEK
ncbi:MAG: Crp/Fnr family transcriptional regulator [Cycloclasticus sp.]